MNCEREQQTRVENTYGFVVAFQLLNLYQGDEMPPSGLMHAADLWLQA